MGLSFSEWKEVAISETIISSNTGLDAIKRAPIVDFNSGIKCLRIQDISQNKSFENWGFCRVESRNYGRFQLKKGDIIIARTGATIGVNKLIKQDLVAVFNNGLIRLRVNKKVVDNEYLFYNMQSDKYKGYIQSISGGTSSQPNMKMHALLDFKINLPTISEQKAIAETLSCLDDKIELNNKINSNLEQTAQAIFKSWFVDFEPFQDGEFLESELGMIPKGWRVGTLGDISSISSGKRPVNKQSEYSQTTKVPIVGASSVMGYTDSVLYDEKILITGRVGTHGIIQRFSTACWASDNTLVIKSDFYETTYQFLLKVDFVNMNRGSTQPLITQSDLKNVAIVIPPKNTLIEFEQLIGAIMKLYEENIVESQALSQSRETLLPKLMSGEIDVSLV